MSTATETLTTAAEAGGIRYWANVRNVEWSHEGEWDNIVAMEVRDNEADDAAWIAITASMIDRAAYDIIFGKVKVRGDILDQLHGWPLYQVAHPVDAEAADCLVQVAAFGDIIFG